MNNNKLKNGVFYYIVLLFAIFITVAQFFLVYVGINIVYSTLKHKNTDIPQMYNFLQDDSLTIVVGEEKILNILTDQELIFVSEDNSLVTIDEVGKVLGIKEGTTNIVAKDEYGNSDKIKIIVKNKNIPIFDIDKDKVQIKNTDEYKINYSLNPKDEIVTWVSSDLNIAEVTAEGTVIAKTKGSVLITGISTSGIKDTIAIEVLEDEKLSLMLDKSELTINKGQNYNLNVTKNKEVNITWSSNNSNIVKVDQNGKITAVGEGTATITASGEDLKVNCVVKVVSSSNQNKSVTLSKSSVILKVGTSKIVSATILPSNSSNSLKWTSSNTSVATVDQSGKITAVGIGNAVITASIDGASSNCSVSVSKSDISETILVLNKTNIVLNIGSNQIITPTVSPSNLSKDIKWTSSNTNIATVDQSGKVTAVAEGNVVINASVADVKANCVVTVTKTITPVKSVSVSSNSIALNVGTSKVITATVSPSNANNKDVKWTSSNTSVATVDQSGKITAVGVGTATVTVTSVDGNKTAKVTVTVTKTVTHVKSVSVSSNSIALNVGTSKVITATVSPSNANNKDVKWTSSNTSIATVDQSGKITAVGVGTATVTVTSVDGNKTATVTVNSTPIIPTKLVLSSSKSEINVGEKLTLTSTISPSNVTDRSITYKSSNTSIATVSKTGVVTAIAKGTVTITGTTNSGNVKSSITINVINKKTITVNFYPNGSSGSVITKTCTTTETSCNVTSPTITRSGFTIKGWNTDSQATTSSLNVNTSVSVSKDTDYYAITSKKVTATFNKNTITDDISIGATSLSCTINNSANSCNITLPSITRSGFSIIGWSTSSTSSSGSKAGSNVSISNNTTYYAVTKLTTDGKIIGATGYSALNSKKGLYKTASTSSQKLLTLEWGKPFVILGETGSFWYVSYNGTKGYVEHDYCMINLPDYIPSITYNITNSYSSIYRSSGYDIPGITKTALYGSGYDRRYNNRLKREEYVAPVTYSFAKKILSAQTKALNSGFSLKLYDSYRPRSVSTKVATALDKLYENNSTVKYNINWSFDETGDDHEWGKTWFIAQSISTHNFGAAVDISLTNKGSTADLKMPSNMHELSTAAIKYNSSSDSRVASNFSKGMKNSIAAQNLHTFMTSSGLTDLRSEWWHFQDDSAYNRLKALEGNGCNFTPQGIVSQ